MYPLKDSDSDKYGYSSKDKWEFLPAFEFANPFYGGIAVVKYEESTYGYIDSNFKELDTTGLGTRFTLASKSPCGFVDFWGTPSEFALFRMPRGNTSVWGVLDKELRFTSFQDDFIQEATALYICGSHVIATKRTSATEVRTSLYLIHSNRMLLNSLSGTLLPGRERYWVAMLQSQRSGQEAYRYYDIVNESWVGQYFHFAAPYSSGLGLTQINSEAPFVFLDYNFESKFTKQFLWAEPFKSGLAFGSADGHQGFYDAEGVLVLETRLDCLQGFNANGHALMLDDEDRVAIDSRGRLVIPKSYAIDYFPCDYPYYQVENYGLCSSSTMLLTASLDKIAPM